MIYSKSDKKYTRAVWAQAGRVWSFGSKGRGVMNIRSIILAVAVLTTGSGLLVAAGPKGASTSKVPESALKPAPKPAPKKPVEDNHGFNAQVLKDLSGFPIDKHKPVVLIFYSKTCTACADAKKPFNDFVAQYGDAVEFVAVDVDSPVATETGLNKLLNVTHVPAVFVLWKNVGAGILFEFLKQATGVGAQSGMMMTTSTVTTDTTGEPQFVEEEEEAFVPDPSLKPLMVKPEELEEPEDELIDEKPVEPVVSSKSSSRSSRSSRYNSRSYRRSASYTR